MSKSYKDLKIYQMSYEQFLNIHRFSFLLPKYETYELGSQIRRSADSVNSNIVEGYGRRKYKKDYLKFLIYAHSSNHETINHLNKIKDLYPTLEPKANEFIQACDFLGGKINNYIKYVESHWRT